MTFVVGGGWIQASIYFSGTKSMVLGYKRSYLLKENIGCFGAKAGMFYERSEPPFDRF